MISSNQPSSLDRLPWKYAFRPLFIGFFLYVAITLYNDGLWLVTLNLNAAESFLSRLSLVIQRLLWDRSLTFTFSSLAFAYTAYKFSTSRLPWLENFMAILITLGLIIGRTYTYQYSFYQISIDFLTLLVFSTMCLGLYLTCRYLFVMGGKVLDYLLQRPVQVSDAFAEYLNTWEQHLFLGSWAVIFLGWLPHALIKYPAGLEWDAYFQLEEYFGYFPLGHKFWPVASSVFMGLTVDIGNAIFGSPNLGVFFLIVVQMLLCSSMLAYSIKVGYELQLQRRWRLGMLVVYTIVPLYFSYCTSLVKDNLYACLVVLFIALLAKIMLRPSSAFAIRSSLYAYLGVTAFLFCIFRKNGIGIVLACLFVLAFLRLLKKEYYGKLCLTLTIVCVLLGGYYLALSKLVLSTPGGVREILSVPFQQTARYVKEYDPQLTPRVPEAIDAHKADMCASTEITSSEKRAINDVLYYEALPLLYDRFCSDDVKATYKNDNTKLPAYFAAWFGQFCRHPFTCLEATLTSVSGFFDIDTECMWIYCFSRNHRHLVFPEPQLLALPKAITVSLTECLWRMPLINLGCNAALAFYLAIYLSLKHLKAGNFTQFCLLIPSLVGILTCVFSPTFFDDGGPRYTLPIVYASPFLLGLNIKLNALKNSKGSA